MHFRIQPSDEIPIYRQIVRQVLDSLAGGRLRPGEQMPSHRELAERLVVSPLTVKKAYDELERDGYLEQRRGQGTFVRAQPSVELESARRDNLRVSLRRLVAEAAAAGVPVAQLIELLREEAAQLRAERRSQDPES